MTKRAKKDQVANSNTASAAVLPMGKNCAKCVKFKPLTEFYKSGKGSQGRHSYCKTCEKARRKIRYRTVDAVQGVRDLEHRIKVLELRDQCPEGMKVCARCTETKSLDNFYPNPSLRDGRDSYCIQCTSQMTKEYHARSPLDRLSVSLNTARQTARRKGLLFDLTSEAITDLWRQQEGLCAYSGRAMAFDGKGSPESVSIDRVDSSKGYTLDNVVLCCTFVNRMKNDRCVDEFVEWCQLVVDHYQHQKGQ